MGYRGYQGVTRDNSGLQGITGVTRGYRRLQEVTGCDERLKGGTWGYRGVQGARGVTTKT